MENFTSIQTSIITSGIRGTAFKIYCLLDSMCYGEKNNCYPSQEYISKQLHICIRTVQRSIRELVQAGLIKVKRRGSISNVYYMLKKVALKSQEKKRKQINGVKNALDKAKRSYNKYKKTDNFNSFTQRNYNFKNLEDMLLGNTDYDPEKLEE